MIDCPTPHKHKCASRKEAKLFKKHGASGRATQKLSNKVRPYLCVCGSWHLGHIDPRAITVSRRYVYHKP